MRFRRTQQCGNRDNKKDEIMKEICFRRTQQCGNRTLRHDDSKWYECFRRTQQCGNEAPIVHDKEVELEFQKNLVVWKPIG